jgi:hypothetical protein
MAGKDDRIATRIVYGINMYSHVFITIQSPLYACKPEQATQPFIKCHFAGASKHACKSQCGKSSCRSPHFSHDSACPDCLPGPAASTTFPHPKHMLSSGTKAVPSPACLRCQLRRVLQHLRPLPATHPRPFAAQRPFSTTYSRHTSDESGTKPPARENTSGVYFKHISPTGRIVGKRGRKQRQTSEALATNSLGEKSEIVVFRDVPQARKKPVDKQKESNYVDLGEESLKGLSLTPEQIQAALSGTGQTPDEEEVTKSIEALRPQAPVIEDEEFDRLIKELLDSYNLKQLSRYLSQSLKSHHTSTTVVRELEYKGLVKRNTTPKIRTISFTRSRWQPGRTPLDVRRISAFPEPSQSRKAPSGSKARAAERIVRVAWGINKKSDEQKVGELEVQMTPWALAMFFDVAIDGMPKYQKLIEPPLLLQRSVIRPYRPDNIIRITARRQDADDVATQLENKVLLIGKQVVQIDDLVPSNAATYPKGQSLQHFRQQDLSEISRRTQSVFMQQKDGKIGIYSFKQSDRANARRLLLSLLDLPSRSITRTTLDPLIFLPPQAGPPPLALVPVFPDKGLHFRDRSKTLVRAVLPIRKLTEPLNTKILKGRVELASRNIVSLVKDFDEQKEEEPAAVAERSSNPSIFWAGRKFEASHTWWVRLGLLLQETTSEKSGLLLQDSSLHTGTNGNLQASSKQAPVFLRQVPGYETLLSYFQPNIRSPPPGDVGARTTDLVSRKSTIVAHFTPSPFTDRGAQALDLFPTLELTMLRRSGGGSEETELKIDGLRAVTGEQHIDIPLPDQVIDLRLTRKIGAYASMPAVLADAQIQNFVAALKQSANSKGALQGTTELTFRMPGWMAETDSDIRKAQDGSLPEISVPYLFERFEQVQSTGFKKHITVLDKRAETSAGIRTFHENFPKSARLQYGEIDAGDIGGRQTEIAFKVHNPQDRVAQGSKQSAADHSEVGQLQRHDNDKTLKSVLVPALAIADFVTRACKGEITILRGSPIAQQSDVSSLRNAEHDVTSIEEVEDGEAREEGTETREEDAEIKEEDAETKKDGAETKEEDAEILQEDEATSNEEVEAKKEARSD